MAQTAATPQFADAPCPFKPATGIVEGKDLQCGYLSVPEDRSVPGSPIIKLAVAILKTTAPHPAPDPVFYLEGGPGGSALALARQITPAIRSILTGNRDLVFVDQRGTGYSQPSLTCPEFTQAQLAALTKRLSLAQEDRRDSAAAAQCHDRLAAQGVNLSAYTSPANAQDIADLRVALGYPAVNLYGSSYGTRLALTVMRDAPEGIRSVVLDAVYGPAVNVLTDPMRSAARDFHLLFSSCRKAPSCNASNPHLSATFSALIRQLDRKPPTVAVTLADPRKRVNLVLTGEQFLGILFEAFYESDLIRLLPQFITGTAHHKYGMVKRLVSALPIVEPSYLAEGMYLSVECSEDGPFVTAADITAAARALPASARADFSAGQQRLLHACAVWHVKPVDPGQKTPVTSAIPTMLMTGEYDPITPPPYAAAVAQTLSHSFNFVYPGLGHGTRFSSLCPLQMAAAFLDDPATRPDDTCIAAMLEPF